MSLNWTHKTCSLVIIFIVLFAPEISTGARRGKNKNTGRELDHFSGDSYSDFVDKYYKNSKIDSEPVGRARSSLSGSGDGSNFEDDEDDEEEEEEASGEFPSEFDPIEGIVETSTNKKLLTSQSTSRPTVPPSSTTLAPRKTSRTTTRSPSTTTITTTKTTSTSAPTIFIDEEDGDLDGDGQEHFDGSGSGDFENDDEDYDQLGKPLSTSTTTTSTTKTTTTTVKPIVTFETVATTMTSSTTTSTSTTTTTATTTKQGDSTTISSSLGPQRKRPTLQPRTTSEKPTTLEPTGNHTLGEDDESAGPAILVSNHILVIALFTSLVIVLCLAILIALCLILRWRSTYTLANTSDEGSNSDSASSDLPIIKRNSISRDSKSHYARRHSPASAPPLALMPPDLSLDSGFKSGTNEVPAGCYGRRNSNSKLRKKSEMY